MPEPAGGTPGTRNRGIVSPHHSAGRLRLCKRHSSPLRERHAHLHQHRRRPPDNALLAHGRPVPRPDGRRRRGGDRSGPRHPGPGDLRGRRPFRQFPLAASVGVERRRLLHDGAAPCRWDNEGCRIDRQV